MEKILIIGAGGFFGAIARYALSGWGYRLFGSAWPVGTFIVNMAGCFLLGALMTLMEERVIVSPALRSFLTIGFLGALTTFSTFSYETLMLMRQNSYLIAFGNVAASVFVGLFAAYLGIISVRVLSF